MRQQRKAIQPCCPGRGQTGAAAVEFAIVVPVLVLLVFGIVQFGMAYNRVQGLNAAVREGARLASVGATYSAIQSRVQASQSLFAAADVQVATCASVSGSPPCSVPVAAGSQDTCLQAGVDGQLTVQATVAPNPSYAINIPFAGNHTLTYSASGVFRCERTGP